MSLRTERKSFQQPSGFVVEIHERGDETLSWSEDNQGNLIVPDAEKNGYCYAKWTEDGAISTGVLVGEEPPAEDVAQRASARTSVSASATPIVRMIVGETWTYANPNGDLKAMVEADLASLGQTGPDWNYAPVTKMKVTGVMATADFAFILQSLKLILVEIDLSGMTSQLPEAAFGDWNQGCQVLERVRLPEGVVLRDRAFSYCFSLNTMKVGNASFEEGVIDLMGATYLGHGQFWCCESIVTVRLPGEVTIGQQMFSNCLNLSKLHFSGGTIVPSVLVDAFMSVHTTGTVRYPAGAFGYNVSNLRLPSGWNLKASYEEMWVYHNPDGDLKDMVEADLASLGQSGPNWNYAPMERVKITGAVTSDDFAFILQSLNHILVEIDLSEMTSQLPAEAFGDWNHGCEALERVRLPEGVVLRDCAFSYCFSLKTLKVGTAPFEEGIIDLMGASYLGRNQFMCGFAIKSVRLSGEVAISQQMFNGCSSLSELQFVGGTIVPSVGMDAFLSVPATGTAYYPAGATDYTTSNLRLPIGWMCVGGRPNPFWTYHNPNGNLKSMVEADLALRGQTGPNWDYSDVTRVKITDEMAAADFTFIKGSLGTILLELDVAEVTSPWPSYAFGGYYAAARCAALQRIRIPDAQLSYAMLYNCRSLKTLQVGDAPFEENVIDLSGYSQSSYTSGTSFNGNVFSNCTVITHVRLPASVPLEDQMFADCSDLSTLQLGDAAFEEGVIDLSGYTAGSYGQLVFAICYDVTHVRLPANVPLSINMFRWCHNLAELSFTGGTTAPAVGSDAFYDVSATGTVNYPALATGYTASNLGLPSGWVCQPVGTWTYDDPNGNLKNMVESELAQLGQTGPNWDYSSVTKLTLSGTMDTADFTFITQTLGTILTELDVSEVTSAWPVSAFCDYSTPCSALQKVRIPDTAMPYRMFSNCESLTTLVVGSGPYEENVINLMGLTATSDNRDVFTACGSITHVRIPSDYKLGVQIFMYCPGLTTLRVGEGAFSENVIDLRGYSAANYGSNVFVSCTSITYARIPAEKDISYQMFASCINLSTLWFVGGSAAPTVDQNAFNRAPSVGVAHYPVNATGYNSTALRLPSTWNFIPES